MMEKLPRVYVDVKGIKELDKQIELYGGVQSLKERWLKILINDDYTAEMVEAIYETALVSDAIDDKKAGDEAGAFLDGFAFGWWMLSSHMRERLNFDPRDSVRVTAINDTTNLCRRLLNDNKTNPDNPTKPLDVLLGKGNQGFEYYSGLRTLNNRYTDLLQPTIPLQRFAASGIGFAAQVLLTMKRDDDDLTATELLRDLNEKDMIENTASWKKDV